MKKTAFNPKNKMGDLKKRIHSQEEKIVRLTEALEKYKSIFNTSYYSKLLVNQNGKILESNEAASKNFGYSKDEFLIMDFSKLFSKSTLKQFNNEINTFLNSDLPPFETKFYHKNGKKIDVELSVWRLISNSTDIFLIIAKDLAKIKAYQKQIEYEKNLFRTLMENIPDRIYFKDLKSKFIIVSNEHAKNFHLNDPNEIIGKCDHDFFDKKHADQAYRDEQNIIKTKKPIISKIEKEKIQKPGRQYEWVNSTKVPIINKRGKVAGVVGISRNVTDLKLAENKVSRYAKELQYLNASKDKFISILAHDLKNPFFSLLGYTEMLSKNYEEFSDKERKEYINNITKISKNSYQLLEDLLNWARSQTGRIEFCPKTIDISQLVNGVVELHRPIADKKNIIIKNQLTDKISVYADTDMIRTVLRNLITNAIKFTETKGTINLSKNETDSHIEIIIEDNGQGIDSETYNSLFKIDSFHKSCGTSNEVGTGLGLIICKEFVEKNGGCIKVKSKLGKGSSFSFSIPKHV